MGDSGPFVSSCSRRQLSRRRYSRSRRGRMVAALTPALLTASIVFVGMAAFVAGRGGL